MPAPRPIDWNDWDHERAPHLPPSLTDLGPCSCDSAEPCGGSAVPPYPWTRQTPLLEMPCQSQ